MLRGFKLRAPQIVQGGTISCAIYAQALAARSMCRPSPTTGSLTRRKWPRVADLWPGASHIVEFRVIFTDSKLLRSGVFKPAVVARESFLDAVFAVAGRC